MTWRLCCVSLTVGLDRCHSQLVLLWICKAVFSEPTFLHLPVFHKRHLRAIVILECRSTLPIHMESVRTSHCRAMGISACTSRTRAVH